MKFFKWPKDQAYIYSVNNRKVAAYHRKIQKQADAMPLFAAQIKAEAEPVEKVMSERVRKSVEAEQRYRDNRAMEWREARIALRNSPCKAEVLAKWNKERWHPPREPHYLKNAIVRAERKIGNLPTPDPIYQKTIMNALHKEELARVAPELELLVS